MRASEAMLLGSTIIRPVMGKQNDGRGGGCALGMIAAAHNERYFSLYSFSLVNGSSLSQYWWMWDKSGLSLPCDCKEERLMGDSGQWGLRSDMEGCAVLELVHLFNYHVMTRGDWNLERLAEWLDSVDPNFREKVVEVKQEEVELMEV